MATDIVQGLFGLTPEAYQAEQNRQAQAEALRFAQLDPFQQANYGLYMGGRQLGGLVGQAMGAQDPQLQMISKTQSLLRGINPADEASIEAGIQEAAQFNPQLAFSLKDTLQNLRLNKSKIEAEAALTEQRLREKAAADPFEQLVRTGKYTPASLSKYKTSKDPADLDLLEKETKANIKEIGVAAATGEAVYLDVNNDKQFIYTTDAEGKQVRKLYNGPVDRTTAKVTATATQKASEAGQTKLAELDAKDVADARKARDASIATVNALNALASYPDDKLISGSFANNRVGVANFLNTLGLASGADKERISNSQQYQKVAGDVILQTLGGKLGSGFSNADREFIASLVPQLETSPMARRSLIDFMQKKNQSIIQESLRMEEHFRANEGSLRGFVPKIPFSVNPANPALGAMTDDQIKAMIAEKRNKGQ